MTGFLIGAAGMFATMYSTQAILPDIRADFGVTDWQAGLTVSCVVAAVAAGALLWGPVSDRAGRKRAIVLASSLVVVPTIGVAVAPTFGLLLAARVAQGLCMPGLLAVSVPYIAEVFIPRIGGRAMGRYVTATVAGGLMGRVCVGLIAAALDWRLAIGALTLLPLTAAIAMRRAPADPPRIAPATQRSPAAARAKRSRPRPAAGAARPSLLRNRAFLRASIGGGALFFIFVGSSTFLSFRLAAAPFEMSTSEISLLYAIWALGAVGPLAGRLADRFGWERVLVGALCVAMAGIAISLPGTLAAVVIGLAVLTIAMFSGVTAAQLGVASAADEQRGRVSGSYFTVYYVVGGLGAFLPGFAWDAWGWAGVVGVGLTLLVAAAAASIAIRMAPDAATRPRGSHR